MILSSLVQVAKASPDYLLNRFLHRYKDLDDTREEMDVGGKVVVITGANCGIGKAMTFSMAKRGAKVVMACRNLTKAQAVIKDIGNSFPEAELYLVKLDLTDLESVRECAEKIKSRYSHVNIIINNAGFMGSGSAIQRTCDGFELHLAANCIGHFVLSMLLLQHLKAGAPSRIVSVGSLTYKFGDPTLANINYSNENVGMGPLNYGPYGDSKLILMLLSKELGRQLQDSGVTTYTLCPGIVATNLLENSSSVSYLASTVMTAIAGQTVKQGAETVMYCAVNTNCAQDTGKAYHFAKLWDQANSTFTDKSATDAYQKVLQLISNFAHKKGKQWLQRICVEDVSGSRK